METVGGYVSRRGKGSHAQLTRRESLPIVSISTYVSVRRLSFDGTEMGGLVPYEKGNADA